jgi:hypothetical protein
MLMVQGEACQVFAFSEHFQANLWRGFIPGGVTLYVSITPCTFQYLKFRGGFCLKKRVRAGTNRPPETSTLPQ